MSKTHTRTFVWRFQQPASEIWPALADTQRFNEAADLPKHQIREETAPDGSVRFFAEAKKGAITLAWEEIPVEWVDGTWFRHLRVFSKGPIGRLCATARLEDTDDGGSICTYLLEASARTLFGELVLRTGFFPSAEKTFTKLSDDVRAWAAGQRAAPFAAPPFEPSPAGRARLDAAVEDVEASGNGHGLARRLSEWMLTAQEVDLMHIRPYTLAERWGAPRLEVVEMMLEAVRDGLLSLRWNLLCPRCRGAKVTAPSLDRLPSEAHCPSCNVDYDRAFSENVEASFHPDPAIREVTDGEFCLFGPMSTPHVKAQLTVEGGATRQELVSLPPGPYRWRTLEPGDTLAFEHEGGTPPGVTISKDGLTLVSPTADSGDTMSIDNRLDRQRTAILESRVWVEDALTAREVTAMQAFRDLFGEDVLRPGDDVGISRITLMFTDIKGSTALYEDVGDAAAYGIVRDHFAFLADCVRKRRGGIVKTIGDAVMAAFPDPADGVACAIDIQNHINKFNEGHTGAPIEIKIGLHMGACIAVTLNERLDYFGGSVNLAARLQGEARAGHVVLSETLGRDPSVQAMLVERGLTMPAAEWRSIRGFDQPAALHRLIGPFKAAADPGTRPEPQKEDPA